MWRDLLRSFNEKRLDLVAKLNDRMQDPESQRRLVLVIVCVALFLDNMLYMVIVPIIPDTLRDLWIAKHPVEYARLKAEHNITNVTHSHGLLAESTVLNPLVQYVNKDLNVGVLFASKAIVQLFVSPVAGTIIDRVGYDTPMIFGLSVIFVSTSLFAFGGSYNVLLMARSLQGVGSAFADTAGLAMIADRFKEEGARSKAQGIALAFISFGCLFAPPFGGFFYKYAGRAVPFILLSLIALGDGLMLRLIMKPARKERAANPERIQGTPIYMLIIDPYIAICAGALVMANVSLAFIEPTIAKWMTETMHVDEFKIGLVWLPPFIPHVIGVYITVRLVKLHPQKQWLFTAVGLCLEGLSCLLLPLCGHYVTVMFPLMIDCFGIALVDTAILPLLAYLVDVRHASVYGSVYAIADISYSLAYAFGPIVADWIYTHIGFFWLNFGICISNLLYAPVLIALKNIYVYKPFEEEDEQAAQAAAAAAAAGRSCNGYPETTALKPAQQTYPSYVMNTIDSGFPPVKEDSYYPQPAGPQGYPAAGSQGYPNAGPPAYASGPTERQYMQVGRVRSTSRDSSDDNTPEYRSYQ